MISKHQKKTAALMQILIQMHGLYLHLLEYIQQYQQTGKNNNTKGMAKNQENAFKQNKNSINIRSVVDSGTCTY